MNSNEITPSVSPEQVREPECLKTASAFTLAGLPDTPNPARDLKALLGCPIIASKKLVCRQDELTAQDSTAACTGLDTTQPSAKEEMPPLNAGEMGATGPAVPEKILMTPVATQWFKDEGDAIILLGEAVDTGDPLQGLGGSAFLQVIHGQKAGTPPGCDLEKEKEIDLGLRAFTHSGVIKSAHHCSEGGLAVALAECCLSRPTTDGTPPRVGAQVDLTPLAAPPPNPAGLAPAPRLDALLFGETRGRIVISVAAIYTVKVLAQAKILDLPAACIGTVGGTGLQIKAPGGSLNCEIAELHDLWGNAGGAVK